MGVWDRVQRLEDFSPVTGAGIVCTLLMLYMLSYLLLWNTFVFVLNGKELRIATAFCLLVCASISYVNFNESLLPPPASPQFQGCEVVTAEVRDYWSALCPDRALGSLQAGPIISCPTPGQESFMSLSTFNLDPENVRSTFATFLPLIEILVNDQSLNSTACALAVKQLTCDAVLPLCKPDCTPALPTAQACQAVNSACQDELAKRWLAGYLVQLRVFFPGFPPNIFALTTFMFDATFECQQPTGAQKTQYSCLDDGQDTSLWFVNETTREAELAAPGPCNTTTAQATILNFEREMASYNAETSHQASLRETELVIVGISGVVVALLPYLLLLASAAMSKPRLRLRYYHWVAYLNQTLLLGYTSSLLLACIMFYVAAFIASDVTSAFFFVLALLIWTHSLYVLFGLPQSLLALGQKRAPRSSGSAWLVKRLVVWYVNTFGYFKGKYFILKLLTLELIEYGLQLASIMALASDISSWEILGYVIFLNVNAVAVTALSLSSRPELYRDMNLTVDIIFDVAFGLFNIFIRRERSLDIVYALVLIVPGCLHLERLNTIKNAMVSRYAMEHVEAIQLQPLQSKSLIPELRLKHASSSPVPRAMKALLVIISVFSTLFTTLYAIRFSAQHSDCLAEGTVLWERTVPQVYFPDGLLSPTSCKTAGILTLDISSEGLTKVNRFISRYTDLQTFVARDNQLRLVPEDVLQLPNIQAVDVRYNLIAYVAPSVQRFWNTTAVLLEGNPFATHVVYDNETPPLTEIPFRILLPLRGSLQTLVARHNHITQLSASLLSFAKLAHLDLSWNRITDLSLATVSTASIQSVNVSFNLISSINSEQLANRNEQIDLSYNRLSTLPEELGAVLTPFVLTGNPVTSVHFGNNVAALPSLNPGYCDVPIAHVEANDQQFPSLDSLSCLAELQTVIIKSCDVVRIGDQFVSQLRPSPYLLDLTVNEISSLPANFSTSLFNMTHLILAYNRFTGIPEQITSLSRLRHLHLRSNKITHLPASLGNLTSLRYLNIEGNSAVSSLPHSIGSLKLLETLLGGYMRLSELPDEICNMTSLTQVELGDNRLTVLPSNMGQLTALRTGRFERNRLTSLSDSLANLSHLQDFRVFGNRLTVVPDWIGKLTSLERLRVYDNTINNLPDTIGNLQSLTLLYAMRCNLTDVPPGLFNLTSLELLLLHQNELSEIHEDIGLLTSLQRLSLYSNKIASVPSTIGNITALTSLSLHSNLISNLPDSMAALTALQTLEIQGNSIAMVPLFIFSLPNLQELHMDRSALPANLTVPSSVQLTLTD